MNIHRLLYSPYSSIIISIILGFGLATLFRKSCESRECHIFKGPPIPKIEDKIYSRDNKCFTYKYKNGSCNKSNRKIVEFTNSA